MLRATQLIFGTVTAVALIGLVLPAPAAAQSPSRESKEQTEDLIDKFDDENAPESDPTSGLPEPGVSEINAKLNWRHWYQALEAGETKTDLLEQLWEDSRGLGYHNAIVYSSATTRAMRRIGAERSIPVDHASQAFETAHNLSPDLPYPLLAKSRYYVDHHPAALEPLVGSYVDGLNTAWQWPDSRVVIESWLLVALLIALSAASAIFFFGQTIRHIGIVAHDISRRLSSAVTKSQVLVLLWMSGILVTLWLNSLLAGLLAIIGLATLPQSVPERAATALAAAALALVPMADGRLVELTEFVGSDAHTLMRAQYFQCDGDCRERLASTLRDDPTDTETAYTAALAGIRAGTKKEVANAEAILQKAAAPPENLRGRWLNLKGAVALASGQTDRAIEHLEEASKIRPGSGTIWFNLMRAYRMAGRNDPASEASHNASANDVEAVRKRSSMNRRDPPSYLLLPPLPAGHFLDQHFNRPPTDGASLLRPVWQTIAGPSLPLRSAPFLGGGLFAIVLLGGVGRRFGLFSSPCPNCGLAREPEDPTQTGGHPHCLPCYRTFVGGAELGYRARVHYETLLGRRSKVQSYLRRILSIVTPGGGHALAGRPFSALAIAASIAFGLVLALHPDWLWSPPAALGPANWLAGGWLGWLPAGLGLLVALRSGWEDITPYERSD